MGMGTIIILFLGAGSIAIWGFMVKGDLPNLDKIGWFLGAGASMFVPYAPNKLADGMKAMRSAIAQTPPVEPENLATAQGAREHGAA